jgi:hypothetical protein
LPNLILEDYHIKMLYLYLSRVVEKPVRGNPIEGGHERNRGLSRIICIARGVLEKLHQTSSRVSRLVRGAVNGGCLIQFRNLHKRKFMLSHAGGLSALNYCHAETSMAPAMSHLGPCNEYSN